VRSTHCFASLDLERAGAPEAPALDLVLTTRLQCFQRHVSMGVCSNACMLAGGGQLGTHSACMFSTIFSDAVAVNAGVEWAVP
jgi:hypothetical protein